MDFFNIKTEHGLRIIHTESLLAVEVSDYLCTFYVESEPSISCVESLQKIHSKLPDYFIRISRNCIINTLHVKSIDFKRKEVKLTESRTCNFSVRNAKILKTLFSK